MSVSAEEVDMMGGTESFGKAKIGRKGEDHVDMISNLYISM